MITSLAKEKYGVSCTEAVSQGIIMRGSRWSHTKNDAVNDGWEVRLTGQKFPTQIQALEAHFRAKAEAQKEHESKASQVNKNTLPPEVAACLNGEESGVRKALRKLRSKVFDEDFCQQYDDKTVDCFFAYLKNLLPNYTA